MPDECALGTELGRRIDRMEKRTDATDRSLSKVHTALGKVELQVQYNGEAFGKGLGDLKDVIENRLWTSEKREAADAERVKIRAELQAEQASFLKQLINPQTIAILLTILLGAAGIKYTPPATEEPPAIVGPVAP